MQQTMLLNLLMPIAVSRGRSMVRESHELRAVMSKRVIVETWLGEVIDNSWVTPLE